MRAESELPPSNIIILPYEDVLELGGGLYSIAFKVGEGTSPLEMRDELMLMMPYTMYVSDAEGAKGYNLVSLISVSGMEDVIVPMLIVGLIMLNTMLGSVYERHSEIGIYSSVGLSPLHIGGLFFAESVVYALVGSVSGYLIGLVATRIIITFKLLPGLTLNYSSFATLHTMGAVMAVAMLSSIYPSVMASKIAVPKIERKWHLPHMLGDRFELDLPFVFSLNEALGGLVYLKTVFDATGDKNSQFCSVAYSELKEVDWK